VPDFDAILFDAGGVLVVPTPSAVRSLLAPYGAAVDDATVVRAHFAAAHAMDHARADGVRAEWPVYLQTFVAGTGVPQRHREEATAAFAAEFDHWMWCHPIPGARDALAGLADRGVPIGIVSNAGGQVQGELARLGICRTVDAADAADAAGERATAAGGLDGVPVACVVDSHVVGVAKPDPAIFADALNALGLPASPRVAYVGDTVFYDVRAAAAAGLTPLLHDPFGFHAGDPLPSGPHRTLNRLANLLALV